MVNIFTFCKICLKSKNRPIASVVVEFSTSLPPRSKRFTFHRKPQKGFDRPEVAGCRGDGSPVRLIRRERRLVARLAPSSRGIGALAVEPDVNSHTRVLMCGSTQPGEEGGGDQHVLPVLLAKCCERLLLFASGEVNVYNQQH